MPLLILDSPNCLVNMKFLELRRSSPQPNASRVVHRLANLRRLLARCEATYWPIFGRSSGRDELSWGPSGEEHPNASEKLPSGRFQIEIDR